MSKEPLEVLADKSGYPKEAYHNEEGMFTVPDPEKPSYSDDKLVQLESGLWVQKPNHKEVRVLWCDTGSGHFQYECDESYEEIMSIVDSARNGAIDGWANLTDPIYGFRVAVPVEALKRPVAIVTQLRDIEALQEQINAYELQKRMSKLQTKGASAQQANEIIKRHGRN
jgi:hypothetical protein